MKKLYAIRNKKTGKIVNDNYGHPHVRRCPEDVFDSRRDELVTLRIEPTEPCEWCDVNDGAWCATYDGRMIALDNEGSPETLLAENWSFCPNCGRSLT